MSTTLHGEFKEPGGKLVVVDFIIVDGHIADFHLSGDFFLEPEETLFLINETLNGMPAGLAIYSYADAIIQAIPRDAALLGITPDGVAIAIARALSRAHSWRELEWQIIKPQVFSPALNVALDEVLVGEVGAGRRGPTMRIWDWDEDAVVIGSFQSVSNEVDEQAARESKTRILRRISGGGAMYMQPEASITYSVYSPTSFVAGLSFEESYRFFDEWVLEALHTLGINASYQPLNDITSTKGKIGGAAQKRLASGAVLHHVTMAYNMDNEKMQKILRIGREKISDKGIASAAKRVDPLRSQTGLPRLDIVNRLIEVFEQRHLATFGEITEAEMAQAEKLVTEKFLTREWLHRVP